MVGRPPYPGQQYPGFDVRWVEDGARLAVTTWGSSSHPTVPRTAHVADGELVLTIGPREPAPPSAALRTADLAACTALIEPPAGLDPGTPTRVHVGEHVVALPAAEPPVQPDGQA